MVEGADDVADWPFVDGADGVVELEEGVELDEGAELDGDWPPADDADDPPLPPLPPLPPEPPPDCAFAAAALASAKVTAIAIIPAFCMTLLRLVECRRVRNPHSHCAS